MEFTKITDEQKRRFDEEGYLVVRNVLDSETISQLIEASDRQIASDNQVMRQQTADGLYDGFRNCVILDDAYLKLLTHEKTFPLVVQLLGHNLSLMTSHMIYRYPDLPDASPDNRLPGWHRDHYLSLKDIGHANIPRHSLKVAYYLTDLSEPDSGVTMMAPTSNHLKAPIEIPEGKADPENAVEPLLQPGDCVFFENRTWHAGAANRTDRIRKAVMFGYCYNWMRPTDYQRQPPAFVEKLNTVGRFLVGESVDDTEEFQVSGGYNPIKEWGEANGFTYQPA